ncbi:hypothetical protein OESDEN_02072 [Oesophagostomum dentatum]|uniref:Uncharacterized protein n=1 Tax=Oesophagostomum dentatum TaxID=61180 RepID=A0A0B1TQ29_OESDE|nr:hypothetical protein OESDEN_02072 [Oesophagostomum dentatum]
MLIRFRATLQYGAISTITPIRITKKGGRLCMIEFDCSLTELGAELERGKDGPEIIGNWIIPPQQSHENDKKATANEKHSDYASMSYEELQAKLFADMEPLPEKKKKWHEEEH